MSVCNVNQKVSSWILIKLGTLVRTESIAIQGCPHKGKQNCLSKIKLHYHHSRAIKFSRIKHQDSDRIKPTHAPRGRTLHTQIFSYYNLHTTNIPRVLLNLAESPYHKPKEMGSDNPNS